VSESIQQEQEPLFPASAPGDCAAGQVILSQLPLQLLAPSTLGFGCLGWGQGRRVCLEYGLGNWWDQVTESLFIQDRSAADRCHLRLDKPDHVRGPALRRGGGKAGSCPQITAWSCPLGWLLRAELGGPAGSLLH
jgi:hypothetical protein